MILKPSLEFSLNISVFGVPWTKKVAFTKCLNVNMPYPALASKSLNLFLAKFTPTCIFSQNKGPNLEKV